MRKSSRGNGKVKVNWYHDHVHWNADSARRLGKDTTERPGSLLEIGTLLGHKETRRTCQNILKVKQALWTFIDQEGVEPTNNAAERALRRGVIWRKHSFGTQSKTGTLFVERILTTVMTLRQQKRNVLDYLTTACEATTLGFPAPSLLPGLLTDWTDTKFTCQPNEIKIG